MGDVEKKVDELIKFFNENHIQAMEHDQNYWKGFDEAKFIVWNVLSELEWNMSFPIPTVEEAISKAFDEYKKRFDE